MKLTDKELSCAASEAQRIWLSALPQKQDLPQHKFSPDFERRMAHMLATQKRNPHLSVHKALRCAVAAILVVLSLTVGALALSETFRSAFIRVVTQIVEHIGMVHYSYTGNNTPVSSPGQLNFGYLPDGFSEKIKTETPISFTVQYENHSGDEFTLCQTIVDDETAGIYGLDIENATIETFQMRDLQATVCEKGSDRTILWTESGSFFTLSGTLPMDELKHIVTEIKILSD